MFVSVVYGISSIFCYVGRSSCGAAGGGRLILSLCGDYFRAFWGLSEFFFIIVEELARPAQCEGLHLISEQIVPLTL